jgi:multiple sugar transport system substrate-binding protein
MFLKRALAFLLVACLAVASLTIAMAEDEKITIRYSYWGSSYENDAMTSIAAAYESLHPNVHVECLYIPNAEYTTKMTAMIASGDEPDVSYLFASDFVNWARQDRFVNLYDLLNADDRYTADSFTPNTFCEVKEGEANAMIFCNELIQLYYNADLFNELGVEPLPASPDKALTWDEFVKTLQTLTIDVNGNNALSPDFDPNRIKTYGFDFSKSCTNWAAMVYQNGGSILSEDGTSFNMTDPKTVDAIQKLSDLINVYHVTPDPLTSANANMSVTAALQSKQVAVVMDGSWSNLDLGSIDINYDVACLPNLGTDTCFEIATSVCGIFNTCEHPDVAWDFIMFMLDPSSAIDLYAKGLWMPVMKEWYTNEELCAKWASPELTSHTPGFLDSAVKFPSYNSKLGPETYIINWSKMDAVIESALDSVWLGEATAEDAIAEIVKPVNSMVEGYVNIK